MLIAVERLLNAPIMSIQTGQPLGRIVKPIINPFNLKIVAFFVEGPRIDFKPAVMFSEDVREFGSMGAIVDSFDNILSPEGMVRLNEVIEYGFNLKGVKVVDDNGRKLGKVENFNIDPADFRIMQLEVKPTFMQSLKVASFNIYRSQVVEVNNRVIVVKSPDIRVENTINNSNKRQVLSPEFDNPFRKPATG